MGAVQVKLGIYIYKTPCLSMYSIMFDFNVMQVYGTMYTQPLNIFPFSIVFTVVCIWHTLYKQEKFNTKMQFTNTWMIKIQC